VDALRALMVAGTASAFGLGLDFAILVGWTVVLVALGAKLYPRVVK
jgi:ABC-2 type transport system permease protein